jgi:uncharacterized protein (DUF302 family)
MGSESTVAGLTTIKSRNGPEETMNRFEAEVRGRGMTVFAYIDHAAGAASAGLSLPPTEVLIFGNAKAGTPLMEAVQTVGIDLPLKVLVWRDENGTTWLSYNDPAWIAERHGVGPESAGALRQMSAAMASLAEIATKAP